MYGECHLNTNVQKYIILIKIIMRKIKFIVAAMFLAVSSSAFAQFTNSSSQSSNVNADGWNTFYFQLNPSKISIDVKDSKNQSFTGLTLGYGKAIHISSSEPLYFETGIAVQYSFYKDDDDDYETYDDHMASAKVPLNILYNFQIPNSTIEIAPYLGATLRYNIWGEEKVTPNSKYKDEKEKTYNLFDKKDMGGSDYTWNRFQIGWQVGVNARFNSKLLLGLSYGTDFSEIYKKGKINTASITIGYCF